MSGMVLRVQALVLRRGERGVLADITFDVQGGELVALMGPSGSGKTTILRVVAGLEPFQSGTVQVEDLAMDSGASITPAKLRALQRKVGMVFQFHHLFEHLPAIKNVWLAPVHAYGVPLREVSGGEAQRVAIARALAVDPPLLLMDEPTASLDPARRMELRDLLRGLLRDGRTLVVATHDEEFARGCATRVLRVMEGRVFEEVS
jgi:ABC-type polar amino acid transport system ATPase subunit